MNHIKHIFLFATLVALIALVLPYTSASADAQNSSVVTDEQAKDSLVMLLPDAVTIEEKLHQTANISYAVEGVRYRPQKQIAQYAEEGIASWYGKQFHGRLTASEERFNMYEMTAAHRILPIPSYVRVTNLTNGKSVVVRINDRGPFHSKRIIDLSYAAAQKLGYTNKGVARVRVEQVIPETVASRSDASMFVTLQKFDKLSDAQRSLHKVSGYLQKTQSKHRVSLIHRNDGYHLRISMTGSEKDTQQIAQDLLKII